MTFDGSGGRVRERVVGRELWALRKLLGADARGVSSIERIGPRLWYVAKLRDRGIAIETVREPHGGELPGTHGPYHLRTSVIIEEGDE